MTDSPGASQLSSYFKSLNWTCGSVIGAFWGIFNGLSDFYFGLLCSTDHLRRLGFGYGAMVKFQCFISLQPI